MHIEKKASINFLSNNGNDFYQLNQTYYFCQNNIDILNMEVAAISFTEQPGQSPLPYIGAGFFVTIVDKKNKILLDSYPLQVLWDGVAPTTGAEFRAYPLRRFKLHDVDIQKCFFKFAAVAGGPAFRGLMGFLNFYLVEKKTNNTAAKWQQSVSTM